MVMLIVFDAGTIGTTGTVVLVVFDAGTIGTTGTVVLVEFDAGTTGEVLFLISGPIGCVGLRYGIAGC